MIRLEQIRKHWLGARLQRENRFAINKLRLESLLEAFSSNLQQAQNTNEVLAQEGVLTKASYSIAANAVKYGEFTRAKRGDGIDAANRYLDHGNYLTYGLAATATWVLGIPHGLAVLHGKTRRGGLVFDIADLIKDALILPQAFISAMTGDDSQEFRRCCTEAFMQAGALDVMIDAIKDTATTLSQENSEHTNYLRMQQVGID